MSEPKGLKKPVKLKKDLAAMLKADSLPRIICFKLKTISIYYFRNSLFLWRNDYE